MVRILMLISLLYFTNNVLAQNISQDQFDEWKPRNFVIPTNTNIKTLSSSTPDALININIYDTIAPVLSTHFGVNTTFRSTNSLLTRVDKYKPFGAFRFPAGSGSNKYFWDCNIPSSFAIDVSPICGTSGDNLSLENFVSFKNNADGEPTVVVNYFYARYGVTSQGTRSARVLQAAKYAAGLVHKLNIELGANIKYWEIGNECYGAWETGYNVNGSIVTGKEYGEDLRVFANEMKKIDSSINIGAVLSHKLLDWNDAVLREVKDHADFLIVHHYFNDVSNQSMIIDVLSEIDEDISDINASVVNNTGNPKGHYPIAFTEFNTRGDYTTTMINGFFVAETLMTMIQKRFSLSSIWVNEWKIKDNHTKGLLALSDPKQKDYSARPSYTPYYYLNKYFGDQMIRTSISGNSKIKVYGSTFSSGEVGMVILNYSNTEKKVGFEFTENTPKFKTLYWDVVHAENSNVNNTKFYVNEITSTTQGGGPTPLSSVVANIAEFANNNVLVVPKLSLTYMVFAKAIIYDMGILFDEKEASCFGDCDGSIQITSIENGIEPFTYMWTTGDTTKGIDLLCAGDYSVTVTDGMDRHAIKKNTITEPQDISIIIEDICNITDSTIGYIHLFTNNNTYNFQWTGPNNYSSNKEDIDSLIFGGCYELIIQDTLTNCSKDTIICIDDYTATDEYEDLVDIIIYPNPTNGIVFFKGYNIEINDLNIYNITGENVTNIISKTLLSKNYIKINTFNLMPGVYIVKNKYDSQRLLKIQ